MNSRYRFLSSKDEYELTNLVRDAFLAAQDGKDVDEMINGLLTTDEKLKIGRRIQVALLLKSGVSGEDIKLALGVGRDTITVVSKHLYGYPSCFELIQKRSQKVDKEFEKKAYSKAGGSKLVRKKKEYTGFKRKDVKR
ncbi:MAG: Trp family transcriptional regulator [Candidatus Levyibacteriota bacterium]